MSCNRQTTSQLKWHQLINNNDNNFTATYQLLFLLAVLQTPGTQDQQT